MVTRHPQRRQSVLCYQSVLHRGHQPRHDGVGGRTGTRRGGGRGMERCGACCRTVAWMCQRTLAARRQKRAGKEEDAMKSFRSAREIPQLFLLLQ